MPPDTDNPEEHRSSPAIVAVAVDGVDRGVGEAGLLDYLLPAGMDVPVGAVVWVPIRRSYARGVVVAPGIGPASGPYALREVIGPVEPPLTIDPRRVDVALWLARETITSPFAALEPFLPPGYGRDAVAAYRATGEAMPGPATPAQRAVLNVLADGRPHALPDLQRLTGRKLTSVLGDLLVAGVIESRPEQPVSEGVGPTERYVRLAVDPERVPRAAADLRSERQRALLEEITGRSLDLGDGDDSDLPLAPILKAGGWPIAVLRPLEAAGLVAVSERAKLPTMWVEGGRADPAPPLTPEQATVWADVGGALAARDSTPRLLRGVTGSGKTEIYLRGVDWCLRNGRGAIILVPEITLATQVVRRFRQRFPGRVAVLHSSLAAGERLAAWRGLADGRIQVVVGARSALFAPLPDVGLIVLDEEHESAYKQDTDPRYHARTLAEELGRRLGAVVLLGSATPSIETSWRVASGAAVALSLPSRVRPDLAEGEDVSGSLDLPTVEIADMRLELHRGNAGLLSETLRERLTETLARGDQALILLNRRGMATVVLCQDGGHRLICPHCDIPLVFHQDRNLLICHRCDYRERPPGACPTCGGRLTYFGAGTQRVEREVADMFGTARVMRWDQDTARKRGAPEAMLREVEERSVDIVVGTQMIAKGLDLPHVTTVGVINADAMLHLPDFRSAERTFQLLTQVAGRAGRRGAGEVVIQTYTPHHYAIRAAARHDYDAFYAEEIVFRDQNLYPPFTRLVRFAYRHRDEARCAAEAATYAHILVQHVRNHAQVGIADILGPTPAFAARIRDEYQWQIVLRSPEMEPLLPRLPTRPGWQVDVDPISVL